MNNPLAFLCRHCSVFPGERCKNYLGKNKQACPDRGKPPPKCDPVAKPQTPQPSLFDAEGDEVPV